MPTKLQLLITLLAIAKLPLPATRDEFITANKDKLSKYDLERLELAKLKRDRKRTRI